MKKISLFTVLFAIYYILTFSNIVYANNETKSQEDNNAQLLSSHQPDSGEHKVPLKNNVGERNLVLTGMRPVSITEFNIRKDEVVTTAKLYFEYTASTSLIPVESQIKIYLNDQLMSVIPVLEGQQGKRLSKVIDLNPLYIADNNKVTIEFIGHYRNICENPANTTIWLDVSKSSYINLAYHKISQKNDLAWFPEPFFDERDLSRLTLPFVFPEAPDALQQQSAAILASWFGAQSQWRGQHFPVFYNKLPDSNAIVFATNSKRPYFLREHTDVTKPTIEIIDSPVASENKLLIVWGKDEKDLLNAAKGIVNGTDILRGESVEIDNFKQSGKRTEYDAPNWLDPGKENSFGQIKKYDSQLQSEGINPQPINLAMRFSPDVYLSSNKNIKIHLNYHYTEPSTKDSTHMDIHINGKFIKSIRLEDSKNNGNFLMQLPLVQEFMSGSNDFTLPPYVLGKVNDLKFSFEYMNPLPGGDDTHCITHQLVSNHVVIDDTSYIEPVKYSHFIEMPNLFVFANSGFPFTKMADLSKTVVVVSEKPSVEQVTLLLDITGIFGASTGLAGSNITVINHLDDSVNTESDFLFIAPYDKSLTTKSSPGFILQNSRSIFFSPKNQYTSGPGQTTPKNIGHFSEIGMDSNGEIAAITGFQSPLNTQKSVIAMIASSSESYSLIDNALLDSGKRSYMAGSVVIVRTSGVKSVHVGKTYSVGHISWWERIWHLLSEHPVWLAFLAVISVLMFVRVMWQVLRFLSHKRLNSDSQL